MDYKDKYIKYKSKYIQLKGGGRNKYAIVSLCMLNDIYVIGACISAYTHKKFKKDIDLVIMCDDIIYNKYKTTLERYYDKVVKIDLIKFDISRNYKLPYDKYSPWIGYSTNKWQCLNFIEYDKILFLDVDILPIKKSFYDILSYNTPAFHHVLHKKECINNNKIYIPPIDSYSKLINNIDKYGSIDGGICLLEPSKSLYTEYIDSINKLYSNGIYSTYYSGPDETSLFYFFIKKNIPLHDICIEYAVVPWDNIKSVKNAKAYNFLSRIKPWVKPLIISWDEEKIWHKIYHQMKKSKELKTLYKKTLLSTLKSFLDLPEKLQRKYYNTDHSKYIMDKLKKVITYKKLIKYNPPETENYGILVLDELLNKLKN